MLGPQLHQVVVQVALWTKLRPQVQVPAFLPSLKELHAVLAVVEGGRTRVTLPSDLLGLEGF